MFVLHIVVWFFFLNEDKSFQGQNPNYLGHQYFFKKGETILTSRSILLPGTGSPLEKSDFQMLELTDNCPSVPDYIHLSEIHFLNILDGSWILNEMPNFRGRQYFLKLGQYRRFLDRGAVNAKVGI
uniref:Beta/gamma crystallin 'Greek key' domain-containing protein n=1 Tax=Apteryx owenii TaxID=8824 RepID=A0A8B9QK33_APTOW